MSRTEQAAVLALVEATEHEWYRTAALIEEVGSATRLLAGDVRGTESATDDGVLRLVGRVQADAVDRASDLITRCEEQGLTLTTVLDEDYPTNLRAIYNRPPFLWLRGHMLPSDDRAVAVVGTRAASETGRRQAAELATELARREVTVLSGLAKGIDAAAHSAALEAGGRTVAVLGHGLERPVYPKENRHLAEQVLGAGALVSQFWPDAPPTRYSFPMRNVVMSGMAVGTVVVEASSTSGAKMQARLCLEHGKRLFLVRELVTREDWAKKYAERPGATVIDSAVDIVDVLSAIASQPEQLALC